MRMWFYKCLCFSSSSHWPCFLLCAFALQVIKVWVGKKVKELIGEEEETLVNFICERVREKASPAYVLGTSQEPDTGGGGRSRGERVKYLVWCRAALF